MRFPVSNMQYTCYTFYDIHYIHEYSKYTGERVHVRTRACARACFHVFVFSGQSGSREQVTLFFLFFLPFFFALISGQSGGCAQE